MNKKELAVKASSAAMGVAIGGPIGAALGIVAGDILTRKLSGMERKRIKSVVSLAAQEINDTIKSGDSLKQGWADGSHTYDEVIENILLKVQREPEKEKLPYIAHLLAHLAFSYEIDIDTAHQLINETQNLSYRQFRILSASYIIEKDKNNSLQLYDSSDKPIQQYAINKQTSASFMGLVYDIKQLSDKQYITAGNGNIVVTTDDIVPSSLQLCGMGGVLYVIMRLELIPRTELDDIILLLRK